MTSSNEERQCRLPSRRHVVAGLGAVGAGISVSVMPIDPAVAMPDQLRTALRRITGGPTPKPGRVTLDIPPLVESGYTVPCKVAVASPMTAADHVRAIHILNEKNPQPNVISVALGPRAGRAAFATRIRLATSQTILAVAEMSDGSFWSASVSVVVTLGACVEEAL